MTSFDAFDTEPLLPDTLPESPFPILAAWLAEASAKALTPNPNAMTLATVGADGRPSARIVLCKALDPVAGTVVFHTNFRSRKGQEIEANPSVALVFHWDHFERQARIEGDVERISDAEADAYFATRPWERRLGAWASQQSQPLASRQELFEAATEKILELDIDIAAAVRGDPVDIPRPPYWGGYRVVARRVELWHGSTGRLHDRAVWEREIPVADNSGWRATRLQP